MNRIEINLITGEQKVIELTQEELNQIQIKKTAWDNGAFDRAMSELRAKRNKLLADSDYIVLADSPVNDKANWLTYRQQLRDLTEGLSTVEQVNSVVFPTKP
jgi:hypothetical protein